MFKLNMNDKAELRKEFLDKRNRLEAKYLIDKSLIIQNKFLNSSFYKEYKTICIYLDFKSEVKTNRIVEKALSDGKEVYVPKVNGDIMEFYQIDSSTEYHTNKFKIREPNVNSKKFQSTNFPSIFIVPGVVFSKDCFRIGYGGGYYDKWIAKNPNNTYIGFAYDFQVIDSFKPEKYDRKIDYIITETCCLPV